MMRSIFLIWCFVYCCVGCGSKWTTPEKYVSYFDDESNGLIVQEEIGLITISAQYRTELYEHMRSNTGTLTQDDMQRRDSLQFVVVRMQTSSKDNDILKAGLNDKAGYDKRIQYLSADIQNDFMLIDGADTLRCISHQWERNYNIANFTNLILVFKNSYTNSAKMLVYDDHLFGLGQLRLLFREKSIQSIPSIAL